MFNKQNNLETFLAIDIGTYSIKVAVFTVINSQIKIIGYKKNKQFLGAMDRALILKSNEVLEILKLTCKEAIELAKKDYENIRIPSDAVVGVAGEIVSGFPVVVNLEREDSEEQISEVEIKKVVKKIKEHTFNAILEEIEKDTGYKAAQVTEIDTYIDSIYIDGLRVTNPLGIRGMKLKYKVFSTFSPKVHYDSIFSIIKKAGFNVARMIVEPYSIVTSIENIRSSNLEGAVVIDIGGGTTDIAVVLNGEIVGTKMFSIGGRVVSKRISKVLNISEEEAEDIKEKYAQQLLDKHLLNKLKLEIRKEIEIWFLGLQTALEEFEDLEFLPSNFLLCGGGAILPEVLEKLLEFPWKSKYEMRMQPKVSYLYPNKLSSIEDLTRNANSISDIAPISLARTFLEF